MATTMRCASSSQASRADNCFGDRLALAICGNLQANRFPASGIVSAFSKVDSSTLSGWVFSSHRMIKALIAGLLVIAVAAGGLLLVQRERPAAAMPAAESLAALLPRDAEGFASAHAPWRFSFPRDHAAHQDYRTESWRFSGNLSTREGRRFAFQLTLLRIGVNPPAAAIGPSAWATREVYWGQFAVTDAAANRFHAVERFTRAAMGQSGSAVSPVRVWLEDWVMEVRDADGERASFHLRAAQEDIRIAVSLRSAKPAVIPTGDAAAGDTASAGSPFHAYVMTRLIAQGTIEIDGRASDVEGHAWLDRAWGLVPVPVGPVVWDRFLLQLDDGRDVMGVRLRRRDGTGEPEVTALLVESGGAARTLPRSGLAIEVLDHWTSPHDGTRFPARWRVRSADERLELSLTPYVAAQELHTSLRSWAGAVGIRGTADGRPIGGDGYVELAGYEPTAPWP